MNLRVLIYRENEYWIAHSLETDYVADGPTPIGAVKLLLEFINLAIKTSCLIKDTSIAPPEIISKFATGKVCYFKLNLPEYINRLAIRIVT